MTTTDVREIILGTLAISLGLYVLASGLLMVGVALGEVPAGSSDMLSNSVRFLYSLVQ